MLTQAQLKQDLHYDPDTGIFMRYPTGIGRMARGGIAGSYDSKGKRQINVRGVLYFAHRLAWLYMTGEWPRLQIDHINGDAADNRWKNLREATPNQNQQNRGVRNDSIFGLKGVYRHKRRDGSYDYQSAISVNGKRIHLGTFSCQTDAYLAYTVAARKYHGEFARY